VPDHTLQYSIPPVGYRSQSVTVLDARIPTADHSRPGAVAEIHTHIIAQEIRSPAIVIARDPQHGDALLPNTRQLGQNPVAATRNHTAPLEPEVKQVAVDYQRSC